MLCRIKVLLFCTTFNDDKHTRARIVSTVRYGVWTEMWRVKGVQTAVFLDTVRTCTGMYRIFSLPICLDVIYGAKTKTYAETTSVRPSVCGSVATRVLLDFYKTLYIISWPNFVEQSCVPWKSPQWLSYSTRGPKRILTRTFRISWSIWIKFGIDLHFFVPLSSLGKSGASEAVSVFRRVQEFMSCFLHFAFVVLFK